VNDSVSLLTLGNCDINVDAFASPQAVFTKALFTDGDSDS
jgi:hypothetical protein